MQITVEQRAQYGAIVFVPLCTTAQQFASIAKTKTLTAQALHTIKAMGYKIEVKHPAAAF
jgi:hypothetical protein